MPADFLKTTRPEGCGNDGPARVSGRRLTEVGELPQQCGLALGPDDSLRRLTVLEQDQRGDRDHVEVPRGLRVGVHVELGDGELAGLFGGDLLEHRGDHLARAAPGDRKSTRLNSSHVAISYAVFCLKKRKWLARWKRTARISRC